MKLGSVFDSVVCGQAGIILPERMIPQRRETFAI
jgi:hypothetical protein